MENLIKCNSIIAILLYIIYAIGIRSINAAQVKPVICNYSGRLMLYVAYNYYFFMIYEFYFVSIKFPI